MAVDCHEGHAPDVVRGYESLDAGRLHNSIADRFPPTNRQGRSDGQPSAPGLPVDAGTGLGDQPVEHLVGDGWGQQLAPVCARHPQQAPGAVVVPRQPERRADEGRARLEVDAHPSAARGRAAEVAGKGSGTAGGYRRRGRAVGPPGRRCDAPRRNHAERPVAVGWNITAPVPPPRTNRARRRCRRGASRPSQAAVPLGRLAPHDLLPDASSSDLRASAPCGMPKTSVHSVSWS